MRRCEIACRPWVTDTTSSATRRGEVSAAARIASIQPTRWARHSRRIARIASICPARTRAAESPPTTPIELREKFVPGQVCRWAETGRRKVGQIRALPKAAHRRDSIVPKTGARLPRTTWLPARQRPNGGENRTRGIPTKFRAIGELQKQSPIRCDTRGSPLWGRREKPVRCDRRQLPTLRHGSPVKLCLGAPGADRQWVTR